MPHPQTRRISHGMSVNVRMYPAPIILEYMSKLTYSFTS